MGSLTCERLRWPRRGADASTARDAIRSAGRRWFGPHRLARLALAAGLSVGIALGPAFAQEAGTNAAGGAPADAGPTVLVVGDSIGAAYGLDESDGWVALAEEALRPDYPGIRLVNASISGDTTGGGLRRLPDALERFSPDVLVIELGGNDGLRAYPIEKMRDNLERMAALAEAAGARTLIVGMMIPSNYGAAYTEQFAAAFGEAAEASGSALLPFLLEPIAMDRNYFQRDGIHPSAEAQPLLVEHALPALREVLEEVHEAL